MLNAKSRHLASQHLEVTQEMREGNGGQQEDVVK